jgi:hypothetical protein
MTRVMVGMRLRTITRGTASARHAACSSGSIERPASNHRAGAGPVIGQCLATKPRK